MKAKMSNRRALATLSFLGFIGCVPLSNWMIANVGATCVPDGPCLVPVWSGIWAPSGVLIAGLSFVLRDLVQELSGARVAFLALLAGGLLSAAVASPALAFASVAAYLLAESLDMGVYTALRSRGLAAASFFSSVAGLAVDSIVFVWLAFGSADYIAGQALGKGWMVLLATPILVVIRRAVVSSPSVAPKTSG
jgi:uncharacterized PurR-regulated membrane protein YhhQ (DUF165 family)